MTDRTIGIGETSSFRYFGVMPPLDSKEVQQITDSLDLPWWVGGLQTVYVSQEFRDDCPPHTEFGIDVGDAIDWQGSSIVDEGTLQVAESIANILRRNGDSVSVLEEIAPTDFYTPIFGVEFDEYRETIRLFSRS